MAERSTTETGDRPRPSVTAICGPSGAGKTTLVSGVARLLGDATMVSHDAYYKDRVNYPTYRQEGTPPGECYARWLREGADPDLFVGIPRFAEDLQRLLAGHVVHMPESMADFFPADWRTARPARFVVIEDIWGRERREMASLIDWVVRIDVPLDICLCRKILRDVEQGWDAIGIVKWYLHVDDFGAEYADGAWDSGGVGAHGMCQRLATVSADLVVDGNRSPGELAVEVAGWIRSQGKRDSERRSGTPLARKTERT